MWKWLELLMSPAPPPTPEFFESRIRYHERELAKLEEARGSTRAEAIGVMAPAFAAWFPRTAEQMASAHGEITLRIGSRLPALKAQVDELARNAHRIVNEEFGDDVWALAAGEFKTYVPYDVALYHPSFGPALSRVANRFWAVMKGAGYEKPSFNSPLHVLNIRANSVPLYIDTLFRRYAGLTAQVDEAHRMIAEFSRQKAGIEAARLWQQT
jgi:hypothetical protein